MIVKNLIVEVIEKNKEKLSLYGYIADFTLNDNRMERLLSIKEIISRSGLELILRVGGCEAFRDIQDSFLLGVKGLLVPLIESNYALKKFVDAVEKVYDKGNAKKILLISSVETIDSLLNYEKIYSDEIIKRIKGIYVDYQKIVDSKKFYNYDVDNSKIQNKIIELVENFYKKRKLIFLNYVNNDYIYLKLNKNYLFVNRNFIFLDDNKLEEKKKFTEEINSYFLKL